MAALEVIRRSEDQIWTFVIKVFWGEFLLGTSFPLDGGVLRRIRIWLGC
jgi:hypothetical protein